MLDFFRRLFASDFMPHKACFLGDAAVVWLHVISDCLIAVAYYLIPILLFQLARRRRDVSFTWIFLPFGMFILACGSSHLLSAITVFNPVYRLEGVMKALTAVSSIATFCLLIPRMSTLVALPSPAQLSRANEMLAAEIEERKRAEDSVLRINQELEHRVASRTESLERALHDLRREMDRRRELEGQLVQSQKMEAVGRLAGGVAHDFNNLLTVIIGYAEMLTEQPDGDILDSVAEIREAAERASALTTQLLAFSRRQVTVPRIVNLNNGIRNVERMLRRIIGEDIELQLQLAADLSPVKVDPSQIDQVILNLAVNSRDAMPNGGKLVLETANASLDEEYAATHLGATPGPYVMLAVTDTGAGMNETAKARAFEPFFTTKEQGKGTGLGLSIVYGIVKRHGGEIVVNSELGHGTVFKIYFPVASATTEAPLPVKTTSAADPATGTILLVEDDDQIRKLTRAILVKLGYRVVDSGLPAEALRLIQDLNGAVDLLLTDLVMPEMTGVELATRVRVEYPRIKALYMSGYAESSVVEQGMITSETAFLRKPFTTVELNERIREVLDGPRGA